MKKVVRLTENDLARIIKRVIAEQTAVVGAPGTPAPNAGVEPMTPEEQKDNQMLASTINNMGLPVDADTIDELDSCPVEENVDPKARPFLDSIKQKIEAMTDINSLYDELRNVLSIKKKMNRGSMGQLKRNPLGGFMNEQALAATYAIAGVAVPGWAIAVIIGVVIFFIVKTIINRTKGNKSYRRKKRHLKKGCYSKRHQQGLRKWMGY